MRTFLRSAALSAAVAAISIAGTQNAAAQSLSAGNGKYEVSVGVGPMFFLGDLGGSAGIGRGFVKDLDFPMTKFGISVYGTYYPSEWLGLRVALSHGTISGDDAEAPNKGGAEVDRLLRNLSFKSSITEIYTAAEIYPTVFFEQYDGLQGKLRPYGVIGIGAFRFNPKAQDVNGQWVNLKPLRLEGQGMAEYPDRKEYKLVQAEIPMGLGVKYYVKENMYVGLEVLHRQTFTDYIDDVSTGYIDPVHFSNYLSAGDATVARRLYYRGKYQSAVTNPGNIQTFQRGDPTDKDAFFSTFLRFGWRLNSEGDKASRRQMRCPVFY